ncbi:glycosyl transferase family 2 [Stenotrophomonas maltophilia]|uniref:glycosyltransferase family 2 protein n=1 Tax=Stenotrophomonas chelatiphaga TaxID=517011 RepID=UPI000F4CB7D9|nr:glycosyltransferase family 2 protein [Stenotrophomonas chelatiphaga]MCS4231250.1 glycosyltransferase involved in cell wall biosynthesis [Stenotrophomonas chelatiphaga]ROQ39156.1 glycosyl transferase family 2 [Stenotrophomonas maltophilia]
MPLTTSIAMCTYNGERFLQAQLDSLLTQRPLPDQIVIRDDVSSDGTGEILAAFVPKAEALGIVVDLQVNERNVGYRRNFDGALRACTGEVIFLCDQDDVWHADKLSRMCAEFEARPRLLALHSDARLIDGEGRSLPKSLFESLGIGSHELRMMHRGDALGLLLKRKMVTGAAMAIRRRVLGDALPLPATEWVHDAWLVTLSALTGQVDSLRESLVDYRLHGGNQLGLGGNDPLPRSARRKLQLQSELKQSEMLVERAQALVVPRSVMALVTSRRGHFGVRAGLPASRVRRLPQVLGEMATGNYFRFGRGLLSAAIDLIRS